MDGRGFGIPRFRPPLFNLERERHDPLTELEFLRENVLVYVWLHDGEGFWFYPTRIDGQFVSGFREMYAQWVLVGFHADEMEGFY